MAETNEYQENILRNKITEIKADRDRRVTRIDTLATRIVSVGDRFDEQIDLTTDELSDANADLVTMNTNIDTILLLGNAEQDDTINEEVTRLTELVADKTARLATLNEQKTSSLATLNTTRSTAISEVSTFNTRLADLIEEWDTIVGTTVPDIS